MMTCTICHHKQRPQIEAAFGAGASLRHIASQFSVGYKAVERHAKNCLQPVIAQIHHTQQQQSKETALDVYKQLGLINAHTIAIATEARRSGASKLALEAFDRVLRQLEFQARLLGLIDKRQVNIYGLPEWQEAWQIVFSALDAASQDKALIRLEAERDRRRRA